jgi:hypothetical protein
MGLEPMTSPLPRECSTTELHQPSCSTLTVFAVNVLYQLTSNAAVRE